MLMIDLFGQVLTPAFVGAALVGAVIDQVAQTSADKFGAINWSTFFCIVQIAMLVAGMFITPVSESRSDRWISIMPQLTKWAREIALMIIPILIIVTNFIGLFSGVNDGVDSVCIFNIIVQFGTLIWYVAVFRGNFLIAYYQMMDSVIAVKTVHRRSRHLGFMAQGES